MLFFRRGENILLFLVQTVGRQLQEQRQYRPPPRGSAASRSAGAGGGAGSAAGRKAPPPGVPGAGGSDPDPEMPEHDLEPPRFSRRALERILNDWTAVKVSSPRKHMARGLVVCVRASRDSCFCTRFSFCM